MLRRRKNLAPLACRHSVKSTRTTCAVFLAVRCSRTITMRWLQATVTMLLRSWHGASLACLKSWSFGDDMQGSDTARMFFLDTHDKQGSDTTRIFFLDNHGKKSKVMVCDFNMPHHKQESRGGFERSLHTNPDELARAQHLYRDEFADAREDLRTILRDVSNARDHQVREGQQALVLPTIHPGWRMQETCIRRGYAGISIPRKSKGKIGLK